MDRTLGRGRMDRILPRMVGFALLTLIFLGIIAAASFSSEKALATDGKKVGAYYYVWYGLDTSVRDTAKKFHSNWENATSAPFVGEYVSSDSCTADTHIVLAKLHKIDFLAVSWLGIFDWFDHLAVDDFLQEGLLSAEHMGNFSFCLLYESTIILDSVYDYCRTPDHNASSPADFFKNTFATDMNYAATKYFTNPSYLRIDGKPVLIIYNLPSLYQNLTAPEAHKMLANLRLALSESIYLVADVGNGPSPAQVTFPLSSFSDVLNATTNYLFSNPSKGWNTILEDARQNFPEWQSNMTAQGMRFWPSAYPAYDNTKENPNSTLLPANTTAFREFLQTAQNNTNNEAITMITSWNEWKENTAIEPSAAQGDQLLDTIPEYPTPPLLLAILASAPPTAIVYRTLKRRLHRRHDESRP